MVGNFCNRGAILLMLFCVLLSSVNAAVVYRPDEGWSVEGEDAGPTADTANEQFKRAEEFEKAGDLKRAASAYRAVVKHFSRSGAAPRAQFKVAALLEQLGNYGPAFDAYAEYLAKYPKGEDFDKAVEAQFKIAQLFLGGEKQRLFGIPTVSSMARAEEMFQQILQNAPYSHYAPMAQFELGRAHEKQGETAEAIAAYEKVMTNYPDTPVAADAQYQIGYLYYRQARAGSYDQASATRARDAFEDFIARFPDSEKVPQAKANLGRLSGRETQDTLGIAQFYEKQKKYKAAAIYYNQVISESPESGQAKVAKTRLDQLKANVGEHKLRAGPERTETGKRARESRKLQAQIDTAARPDYLGPPVPEEPEPDRPKLRGSSEDIVPIPAVEPELPSR
jgi:outer membrane protein assembly factor BamD